MYFIENINYFLNTDYGRKIPEEIWEAMLERAQESATKDGIIHNSSTRYIFANIHFEQFFEESLTEDKDQLKIMRDLAKDLFLE